MEDRLDQVDLWACVLGIVLITLIDVGRPSPLWKQRVLNCVRIEKLLGMVVHTFNPGT